MSDRIQIEPVIGWPAHCDEIISSLSLAQLEVSNLKVEISDLQGEISALRSGIYLASVVEERDAALAENDRLRKALLQSTVSNLRSLIDWLDENEENAVLLVASLTEEQLKAARAALEAEQ